MTKSEKKVISREKFMAKNEKVEKYKEEILLKNEEIPGAEMVYLQRPKSYLTIVMV